MRHAKSSWDNPELSDFERPLNIRGYKDAPLMGKILRGKKILPDQIISSPALRAYFTARTVADQIGYPLNRLYTNELIYDADIENIFELIHSVKDRIKSLMLFGHNPSLTLFSNCISDKNIDNIPTCGFVEIELNIEGWKEVVTDCGKLISFDFPKNHYKKQS